MKKEILNKINLLILATIIGFTLLIYGILNPNNPINTFKSGEKEVTIINIKKSSDPNYILFFGVTIVIITFTLFMFEYFKKPKPSEFNRVKLTNKENQVIKLIQQGKTNKEIANELYVSISTVKTHINNIFKKLNVSKRNELISKNYKY